MSAGNFTNKPGIKGEYNYIRGLACPSWSGSILAGGYKVCVSSLSKCDILVCPVSLHSPSLIARSFTSSPQTPPSQPVFINPHNTRLCFLSHCEVLKSTDGIKLYDSD